MKIDTRIPQRTLVGLIWAGVVLAGCAASPKDYNAEVHAGAQGVQIILAGTPIPGSYSYIGPVDSQSCDTSQSARFPDDTDEVAHLVKLKAAEQGANAVINYRCRLPTLGIAIRCLWPRICSGDAVYLQSMAP